LIKQVIDRLQREQIALKEKESKKIAETIPSTSEKKICRVILATANIHLASQIKAQFDLSCI